MLVGPLVGLARLLELVTRVEKLTVFDCYLPGLKPTRACHCPRSCRSRSPAHLSSLRCSLKFLGAQMTILSRPEGSGRGECIRLGPSVASSTPIGQDSAMQWTGALAKTTRWS